MKQSMFAAGVASVVATVVATATVIVVTDGGGTSTASGAALGLADARETISRLEDAVGALEARCADLERQARAPAPESSVALARAGETTAAGARAGAGRGRGAAADGGGDDADANEAAALREAELLALSEPGGLKDYVARVIEDDRRARHETARQHAEERARERRAMHEGPYGEFNFKVNSLAKKLELDDRQKQYYYELLSGYVDRLRERRESVAWDDPESVRAWTEDEKAIRAELDGAVVAGLDQEQSDAYEALPDWERNPEGAGGNFVFSTTQSGENGVTVRALSFGDVSSDLVVPPSIAVDIEGPGDASASSDPDS